MGSAVLVAALNGRAVASAGCIVPGKFVVSCKSSATAERLEALLGDKISIAADNQQLVDESDVVVLAVKPHMVAPVLSTLHYSHYTVIISLLAGTTIDTIRHHTSLNTYIVRATTNTAAKISQGMTALSFQTEYNPHSPITAAVEWLFTQTGQYIVVDESKQDAAIALCGSAPAFAYMFVEALADGAVKMGLPHDTAQKCAAQVLVGAGKMVLEGQHPAVLRNAVCTPGGTTINGLAELEKSGLRAAVISAIDRSATVAREIAETAVRDAPRRSLSSSRQASAANLAEMAEILSRRSVRSTTGLER